jgi:hypothetical protein
MEKVETRFSWMELILTVLGMIFAACAAVAINGYLTEAAQHDATQRELAKANERIADISYDYGMCSGKRWLEDANAKAMMLEMDMGGGE